MRNLKKLYEEYKSIILYVFFGGLTTLVNVFCYLFSYNILNCSTLVSNSIAWGLSVLFAFITNKLYVFEAKNGSIKELICQMASFVSCRVFSGMVDTTIMVLLVDFMNFDSTICKFITNVIVMILNYFASKFVIFKKRVEAQKNIK